MIRTDWKESFQESNRLLTSTPILKIVDPNENFMVCIYSCKERIGGFLMQNGHVLYYKYKKIKGL